ncbi:MFS transporter [Rhodococcus sp. SGAir0479]|uniref:MFS transporter n=1 Tax=Rhodococcus sp. SGAir0479 TaxID=2567884 RepID=UPI0010CD23A0|nr:MFS transporter [Rhodococcus sp. SGAir0479]QCQ91618.1 MFS transporter [Rhodococcus sp. SGAir0479]
MTITLSQLPGVARTPVDRMDRPYPRRWAALAVLCLSLLIVVMANTALIVAAPDMTRDLQLSSADLQWVIDGYTVPYAALMLLFGVLGDKYSRRGALFAGLVVFGGGAVFGSLADGTTAVIGARMVMGVGAAIIMPATLSLLVATFPAAERARAIAAWAATSGLAIALGPLLAGWLLENHSWHSTFLINVPIAACAIVAALVLVPPSRAHGLGRVDWFGGLLSVVTIGGLVFAIIDGFHFGWGATALTTAAASAVGLAAFLAWELRHPQPLLNVRKLGERAVGGAALAVLLVFLAAFGAMFFIAQQFQFVLGFGPLDTGVRLLPLAAAVSVGAAASARLAPRVGTRSIVAGGMLVAAAGVLVLVRIDAASGYLDFVPTLVLLGVGVGLAVSPATDAIMGSFPDKDLGAAGGLNDTAIELGGSLGIAILGSVLAAAYKDGIAGFLAALPVPKLTGPQADLVAQGLQASGESVGGAVIVAGELAKNPLGAAQAQPLMDAATVAFTDAISRASLVGGLALAVGAVVVAAILPSRTTVGQD